LKKLKYLCLAFLVASLLAIPAAAQKGATGHHSTSFGQPHGQMGADKDTNPATKGQKEGWEKKAKHKAKAKGHTK
jgi:hypothetical protein